MAGPDHLVERDGQSAPFEERRKCIGLTARCPRPARFVFPQVRSLPGNSTPREALRASLDLCTFFSRFYNSANRYFHDLRRFHQAVYLPRSFLRGCFCPVQSHRGARVALYPLALDANPIWVLRGHHAVGARQNLSPLDNCISGSVDGRHAFASQSMQPKSFSTTNAA